VTKSEHLGRHAATFYTVADEHFFAGVVALVNSLRLLGHEEPVVVGDFGLRPDQHTRLAAFAEVVTVPADLAENPLLYKPFPRVFVPDGVVVIIDSDMVVTRRLDDVLREAAQGRICLFSDETQEERFFPELEELFALAAPLRRQPSLNSCFVAFDVAHWPDLLPRWWEACSSIPSAGTRGRGGPWTGPYWDGDRDALNALLMSEVPPGAVTTRPSTSPTCCCRSGSRTRGPWPAVTGASRRRCSTTRVPRSGGGGRRGCGCGATPTSGCFPACSPGPTSPCGWPTRSCRCGCGPGRSAGSRCGG